MNFQRFTVLFGILSLLVMAGFGFEILRPQLPQVYAAQDCESKSCNTDDINCLNDKKACWEGNIAEAQQQSITLQSTINLLNGQIQLQQLEVNQTEAEISLLNQQIIDLTGRISGLEVSLDRLSEILVERVQQHYKRQTTTPVGLLLFANSLNSFLSQRHYVQLAQQELSQNMQEAENQRFSYDQQKQLKEDKQAEVAAKRDLLKTQQADLTRQKSDQQVLLTQTKNNEAQYQDQLAKTLGEINAIQDIIAGKGDETQVGEVEEGKNIASIIVGASACSTGTHLHFEVVKDGAHRNPAEYLRSIDAIWRNTPDDSFGFGGDWNWPVNNPAQINQGYGMTYYARVHRAYGGAPHTGIDIVSKDLGNYTVKAVKKGTLYRGSIPCGSGLLRYVRVDHGDNVFTYYLHINY